MNMKDAIKDLTNVKRMVSLCHTPAIDIGIAAITRGIPEKPHMIHESIITLSKHKGDVGQCMCEAWVMKDWKFCPMCGHAIEWEEHK